MSDIGSPKLKEYLEKIVRTLELKTSIYNFTQMATTNMGLMCQIVFRYTEKELHKETNKWVYNQYYYANYNDVPQEEIDNKTIWNYNVRKYWALDGTPNDNWEGLFYRLHKMGFTRNRIIELEYLSNPVVSEKLKDFDWGYVTKDIFEEKMVDKLVPIMVTNETEKWVPSTTFFGKLFGKQKKITEKSKFFTGKHNIVEELERTKIGTEKVKTDKDFSNPRHVVIYYKKWIELIEEQEKVENNKSKFQQKLDEMVKKNK